MSRGYGYELFKNGLVKQAIKPDTPVQFKNLTDIDQKEIEFCLNCKKKKCSGECREVKEYRYNLEHGYEK